MSTISLTGATESNSGWLGPYNSGQEAAAQKSWSAAGTYTVRAKAKDINQSRANGPHQS